MASDDDKKTGSVVEMLLKTTEALTSLNASVASHSRDYNEGRQAAREHAHSMNAKFENLDRSVGELCLAVTKSEKSRTKEMARIYEMLGEERKDRREAVSDGREEGKGEKELLRDLIREELGDRRGERKDNRVLVKTVSKEIWEKGGKYIVLAITLLILAGVMKATGMNLADILGLAGK